MTTTLAGVLTDFGASLIEAAYRAGNTVVITHMAIGDGGGNPVTVGTSATKLVGEFHRQLLDNGVDDDAMIGGSINYNPIPSHRGKWLRELGLFDASGNLIIYAGYSPTQIPDNPNMAIQFIIGIMMPVMNVDSLEVLVNPNGTVTQDELKNHTHRITLSGDATGSAAIGSGSTDLSVSVSNATSADSLSIIRKIGGIPFNATSDIDLPGVNIQGDQNTTGNASTASTLKNSHKINGTAFNGSADIITDFWGKSIGLSIGKTSKNVNGSNDISYSLDEIGAAPADHSHSFVPHVHTAAEGNHDIVIGGVAKIGTYAFLKIVNFNHVAKEPGNQSPGTELVWSGSLTEKPDGDVHPPGTWRCMGYLNNADEATLWLRIA